MGAVQDLQGQVENGSATPHYFFNYTDYSMPFYNLYLIELEGGKWYVWKHPDPSSIPVPFAMAALYTPWKGVGTPAWVEKYRPLPSNPVPAGGPTHGYGDDEFVDRVVWKLMMEKGVDNVRGGSFQAVDLTKADAIQLLRKWNRTPEPPTSSEIEIESLMILRRIAERLGC